MEVMRSPSQDEVGQQAAPLSPTATATHAAPTTTVVVRHPPTTGAAGQACPYLTPETVGRALGGRLLAGLAEPQQQSSAPGNVHGYTCGFYNPDHVDWMAALSVTFQDVAPNTALTDLKVCPPKETPATGVGDIASYCVISETNMAIFGAEKIAHNQMIDVEVETTLPGASREALGSLVKQVLDAQ
ncbi:hypothetical protein JJ691_54780 [Kutzneria sp. CA-103260]|nr:hypothetical protein JJ691_54780 [Kutzneria sp. CA-103260]